VYSIYVLTLVDLPKNLPASTLEIGIGHVSSTTLFTVTIVLQGALFERRFSTAGAHVSSMVHGLGTVVDSDSGKRPVARVQASRRWPELEHRTFFDIP